MPTPFVSIIENGKNKLKYSLINFLLTFNKWPFSFRCHIVHSTSGFFKSEQNIGCLRLLIWKSRTEPSLSTFDHWKPPEDHSPRQVLPHFSTELRHRFSYKLCSVPAFICVPLQRRSDLSSPKKHSSLSPVHPSEVLQRRDRTRPTLLDIGRRLSIRSQRRDCQFHLSRLQSTSESLPCVRIGRTLLDLHADCCNVLSFSAEIERSLC